MKINDVVQFNENHKWCGCLGIIREIKDCNSDTRYMVGVPAPQQGTVFIFVMASENAIEKIGQAVMVLEDNDNVKGYIDTNELLEIINQVSKL